MYLNSINHEEKGQEAKPTKVLPLPARPLHQKSKGGDVTKIR